MKKILFSLFALFSLFFVNDSVFANSSLNTFSYTQEDHLELLQVFFEDVGNKKSQYDEILVVYDSGLDVDYSDFQNGIVKHDPYLYFYAVRESNSISTGILSTHEGKNVNSIYFSICDGYILRKNLITGEIDSTGFWGSFPGCGGYHLGRVDTYAKNWLIVYGNYDFEYNGKVIFKAEDSFDISGSIEQGSDSIDDMNKNLFERIWDTIKSIFNTLVNGFKSIVDTLVEGFKNMIDAILSLPEKIGNPFNGLISFVFPDQEYFEAKIAVIDKLFSDELGFLYESFEFMFDIINRFLNIGSGSKIISIPTIKEPISGNTIINGTTLNFNDILSTSNIKTLHTLYLAFVDVIIFVGLLNLGRKEFDKVVGGHL